jgi:regulator of replication initiation timing
MNTYSVKEASEITGIPTRTIHYTCKRDNVRKVSNKYQITDELIALWIDKKNDSPQLSSQLSSQLLQRDEDIAKLTQENDILRLEIDSLKTQKDLELESLRIENESLKNDLKKDIPHQDKLKQAIQLITLEAMEQNVTHKVFTDEEYQDLIGTISEVDFQTKQVEYLKNRIEKQDGILHELATQIRERNFIEAKDKGYDKK